MSGLVFYEKSQRAHRKPGRAACTVPGCAESMYCRALCVRHYTRLRKRGAVGSADRERGTFGEGHVNQDGYRIVHAPKHPLAAGRAQNKIEHHRIVLYDALGPGEHPCHWCGRSLPWTGPADERICVDHLDFDRLHNDRVNLVPACLDCNTKRQEARAL